MIQVSNSVTQESNAKSNYHINQKSKKSGAQNTEISPNLLVWKFFAKVRFSAEFQSIRPNSPETLWKLSFSTKFYTPANYVEWQNFIRNLEVVGSPLKENLFGQSVL